VVLDAVIRMAADDSGFLRPDYPGEGGRAVSPSADYRSSSAWVSPRLPGQWMISLNWAGYTINMFEFEFPTGTGV
jgi:hypothetical protein